MVNVKCILYCLTLIPNFCRIMSYSYIYTCTCQSSLTRPTLDQSKLSSLLSQFFKSTSSRGTLHFSYKPQKNFTSVISVTSLVSFSYNCEIFLNYFEPLCKYIGNLSRALIQYGSQLDTRRLKSVTGACYR